MTALDAATPTPTVVPPAVDGSMDERRDVKAAQGGDTAAFERLYRRHVGRVYALCLRMCGQAGEAEELTQEAFVRCWRRLETFGGQSAFGSWLHRLTVNTVLAAWRSAGRYRERVLAVEDVDELRHPEARHTPGHAVDLEKAVAALPAGARLVFVLHDVEGWKHREIAEHTGLALGTSKTQLHRARRLLKEALG